MVIDNNETRGLNYVTTVFDINNIKHVLNDNLQIK